MVASPPLAESIRQRIRLLGPLPFSVFMEEALYHEDHGYYSDPARKIGRSGDFYTSVSVGPLFGTLLADFAAGTWEALGRPAAWSVVEQGAHDGNLLRDLRSALEVYHPEAAAAASWVVIESRPAWRAVQEVTLSVGAPSAPVRWVDDPASLPRDPVLFLSNELVDALPVDVVCYRNGIWWERHVGLSGEGEGFIWIDVPASPEVAAAAGRLGLPAAEGWTGELRRATETWSRHLYSALPDGVVLTMDYGDLAEDLHGGAHPAGTLRAYAGHRQQVDPLTDPGGRDLTAHVDFSILMREGEGAGWRTRAFLDQHRFLTALAARPGGWMSRTGTEGAADPSALRQFRTLTHPELLGRVFRVLVQARGRCAEAALPGVDFARSLLGTQGVHR